MACFSVFEHVVTLVVLCIIHRLILNVTGFGSCLLGLLLVSPCVGFIPIICALQESTDPHRKHSHWDLCPKRFTSQTFTRYGRMLLCVEHFRLTEHTWWHVRHTTFIHCLSPSCLLLYNYIYGYDYHMMMTRIEEGGTNGRILDNFEQRCGSG